jgi:hypothetical protein
MSLRIHCACPECMQEFYVEVFQVIDLGEYPKMRKRLLEGQINLAICPHCGCESVPDVLFLVNDPQFKRVIFFVPGTGSRMAGIAALRNLSLVAFPKRRSYFKAPLIVSDWNELIQFMSEGADL